MAAADSFCSAGFSDRTVEAYGQALSVGNALGIAIVVVGAGASVIALELARCLSSSNVVVIDVGVGIARIQLEADNDGVSDDARAVLLASFCELNRCRPRLILRSS